MRNNFGKRVAKAVKKGAPNKALPIMIFDRAFDFAGNYSSGGI
jgi:hypothetical protein